MGWTFSGSVRSITPSTSDDNWTLDAVSHGIGKLLEFWWGGETTTSTAMATRVARSSGEAGGQTAIDVTNDQGATEPTNLIDLVSTYATTQPTLNAADIVGISWNAHGGLVRWVAGQQDDIMLVTGQALDLISCRNSVGVGVSSYGVRWEELA